MKRILLYILLLTGSFSVAHAQEAPEDAGKKEQRIRALYVAYVTKELNLTETEAQKFWPVHAQFESEVKSVGIDLPELDRQQAILNIKKKYQDRFTGILGGARSNKFYVLHGEFTKKLVDEIRKRRQQNNMNSARPGKRRNF
jgi:hypothetical protein